MERDPVCGMTLKPGQEEASFNYQGQTYHFCSTECCERFKAKPQEHMKAAQQSGTHGGAS